MDELGLFPLPLVLLPTERVPLHIFEERYKELIGECIAEEREFGLLLEGAEVGTTTRVADVLERLSDGRLNVVVEGVAPFRIVQPTSGRSFLTAEVEPLPDEDDEPDELEVERALAAFLVLVSLTGADVDVPEPGPEISFALAARVAFANDVKQELLELRSPRLRLLRVTELLDRAAEAIELEQEVQRRSSGNGHVR